MGAFRAERTVNVVPLELIELGKMGASRKKWVLLELIELKKVGAFRDNKTQKRGLYRGIYPYCFNMGVTPPGGLFTVTNQKIDIAKHEIDFIRITQ